MNVLSRLEDLAQVPNEIFLAIGVFDGLHLGHQAVITHAIDNAKAVGGTPVMLTFYPHPLKILRPQQSPHLLASKTHKEQLASRYGLFYILEVEFTSIFAQTPPQIFIQTLVNACAVNFKEKRKKEEKEKKKEIPFYSKQSASYNPHQAIEKLSASELPSSRLRQICVGHNWSFGKNRAGNVETLRLLGKKHHFSVIEIPQIKVDGKIVSSTRIREAITRGDFAEAERCLGRPYTILGDVLPGAKLGSKLGFPTANLSTHSEQFPPNGVYMLLIG